jgi:hypothetical protein
MPFCRQKALIAIFTSVVSFSSIATPLDQNASTNDPNMDRSSKLEMTSTATPMGGGSER